MRIDIFPDMRVRNGRDMTTMVLICQYLLLIIL
jgi:hypothetical protein